MIRRASSLGLVVALLLGARVAAADVGKAKEEYKAGMASYVLGQYEEAIKHFEAGFKLEPSRDFLFNIAKAYGRWNKPDQAVLYYHKYIDFLPEPPPDRAEVEKEIDRIEKTKGDLAEPAFASGPDPAPAPTANPAIVAPPPAPAPAPKRWPVWVGIAAGVVAVGIAATVIGVAAQPHVTELAPLRAP